jgi:hypothetical protein
MYSGFEVELKLTPVERTGRRFPIDQSCAPTPPAPRSELAVDDQHHRGKKEPQIRPTPNHNNPEQSRIQTKAGQQQTHQTKMKMRRPLTPTQISRTPSSALERSATRTKEGWRRIILQRCQRLRHANVTQKSTPKRTNLATSPSLAIHRRQANPRPRHTTTYPIYIRTAIHRPTSLYDATAAAREEESRRNRRRNVIRPLFALGNCSKGKEARKRGVRVRVI